MDWLSRIFAWLSEHEAGISAVVGIAVLAGILFTGIRFLLSRRPQPVKEGTPEEDPPRADAPGALTPSLAPSNSSGSTPQI